MRAFRTLSLVVAAAAIFGTACGEGTKQLDNGPVSYDLVKYFGLQVGRCFEYTTKDSKQAVPDLGVVVTRTWEKSGVLLYDVVYLGQAGASVMEDWFSIDGNNLMLHRRAFPSGKTWIYAPPVQFARAPVKDTDHFDSTTPTEVWDSLGHKVEDPSIEHTLSVDVYGAPATLVPALTAPVDALKVSFSETPARSKYADPPGTTPRPETRTFIPGAGDVAATDGWLVIENNFSTNDDQPNAFYKLQGVRDVGTDPTQIVAKCGQPQ